MMKRHALAPMLLAAALVSGPAAAQLRGTATFEGQARIGPVSRPAKLHLSCSMSSAEHAKSVAAAMELADAEQLRPVFDVNPFEGPPGIGARSQLAASAGNRTASASFSANGSFGENGAPATSFTFSATMLARVGRRSTGGFERLQALADVLAGPGPGRLTWRIENAAKNGAPIEAAFDLTAADAARLRSAMDGCRPPAPDAAPPRRR